VVTTIRRGAILLAALLTALQGCSSAPALSTTPVARQTVSQTVTATGSTAPQDTVLVGSQDSGTIQELLVDYNSRVRVGQVLARLDPSSFQATLDQAKATLAQVEASHAAALANETGAAYTGSAAVETARSQQEQIAAADEAVRKTASALALAELTERRDRALLKPGYVAQNVVDTDVASTAAARAAYTAATTEAKSSREVSSAGFLQAGSSAAQAAAARSNARASSDAVRAAEAAVRYAQINLDRTVIKSPVDGTVIQRNVSVGQTVAAALAAPTLFTIAKDLAKMEIDIQVGEPDVGVIREGQRVDFTVLAYPGHDFVAKVAQVRQNPTVVNNVTTYLTVVYADNREGLLRSGMTANATIRVATYENALVVPLAALQWRPGAAVKKAYTVVVPPVRGNASAERSVWGKTNGASSAAVSVGSLGRVYVLDGRTLRGTSVRVLAIAGTTVAVDSVAGGGTLAEGAPVVDGENAPAAGASP
jgi:HlyD family secretion protein